MKEINLEIISRDKTGKSSSKQLRNTGKVPAVIYGDKNAPQKTKIEARLERKAPKCTPEV